MLMTNRLNRNKKAFNVLGVLFTFLLLAAFLVMPAWADIPGNDGRYLEGTGLPGSGTPASQLSTYVVSTPTASTSINVTLVVEAGNAFSRSGSTYTITPNTHFFEVIPVTLTSGVAKNFYVNEVLAAVSSGSYDVKFYDSSGLITSSSTYVNKVTRTVGGTTHTWQAGQTPSYFDGWEFRVNDQMPIRFYTGTSYYEGTTISQTPVQDGDVIHFFNDYPKIESGSPLSSKYQRAVVEDYDSGTLTVQLQNHIIKIEERGIYPIMIVDKYIGFYDYLNVVNLKLYDSTGSTLIDSANADRYTGEAEFDDVDPGTYLIKADHILKPSGAQPPNNALLNYTGVYSMITVP